LPPYPTFLLLASLYALPASEAGAERPPAPADVTSDSPDRRLRSGTAFAQEALLNCRFKLCLPVA
jgi:hypothetical protein